MSLPIRRARIENTGAHDAKGADYVAPHTGSENWKRNKSCKTKLDGSLPMRGARIEIVDAFASLNSSSSLPTQGTRIEVFKSKRITLSSWYRSPCRERELKSDSSRASGRTLRPLPTQESRVEITIISILLCLVTYRSPRRKRELKSTGAPAAEMPWYRSTRRERELKLMMIIKAWLSILSLPTRGTRIEIRWYWRSWRSGWIAPHAGSENRNFE